MRFLRASGLEAAERVDMLIEADGADAVFDEIERLESDYAVRRYIAALAQRETLSPAQIERLVQAAGGLKGDHDRAQALQALARNQKVGAEALGDMFTLAAEIESDYEKRRVLTALAEKGVPAETVDLALGVLASLDSDHDLRLAAESLLNHAALNETDTALLLTTAGEAIDSDHDLRLVLEKAAPRVGHPAVAEAWIAAFREIDSDYDRRVALMAAAAHADAALKSNLRAAAEDIDSDYDRERALAALQ